MNQRLTIAHWIAQACEQLAPITETPRLEAELLLARALDVPRASLLARLHETADLAAATPLLARRLNHEPLAHIFGEWEFFGLSMLVQAPLLTPRPETEHLVEAVLAHLTAQTTTDRPCVADVCCGTGCVATAIAWHAPHADVYACDIRADAVDITRRNAERHHVRVTCVQGDLFAPLDARCNRFDVVAANPPYVPEHEWASLSPVITKHEDPQALLAGADGLDILRRIIRDARTRLKPGGMLALEVGEDQYESVAALMHDNDFESVRAIKDLARINRIAVGLCAHPMSPASPQE